MNLLAFDTSTERMSVAVQVLRDGSITCWQHEGEGGAQTSTHLIPSIQALMVQAALGLRLWTGLVHWSAYRLRGGSGAGLGC